MHVRLNHKQKISRQGWRFTNLLHVKVMTDEGKFLGFARITPELLFVIDSVNFDIEEKFLNWQGKEGPEDGNRELF